MVFRTTTTTSLRPAKRTSQKERKSSSNRVQLREIASKPLLIELNVEAQRSQISEVLNCVHSEIPLLRKKDSNAKDRSILETGQSSETNRDLTTPASYIITFKCSHSFHNVCSYPAFAKFEVVGCNDLLSH